jgi:hypothetical protein
MRYKNYFTTETQRAQRNTVINIKAKDGIQEKNAATPKSDVFFFACFVLGF